MKQLVIVKTDRTAFFAKTRPYFKLTTFDSEKTVENYRGNRLYILFKVLVLMFSLTVAAKGQEHRHPPQDMELHERFYSTWMMPDQPTRSCCNKADCYPTEARFHHGHWQAKRREDGKWLWIPPAKLELNRDNPDGRNHLCAPPPSASYPPDTVFCFALGGGT